VHVLGHAINQQIGAVGNAVTLIADPAGDRETHQSAITKLGKQMAAGEIGTLRPGTTADVSVLSDDRGRFILQDNEKTKVVAERLLQPLFCLRAGKRYDADAAILPQAVAA